MNPNIAANQQRLFLAFVAELRPHIGRDSALPRRIKDLFARHRAIGSRDRKLYRELVYTYLRFYPWINPLLDTAPDLAAKLTAWLAPDVARQRGDGQTAGLAPTAGSVAGGARSAGAPGARDKQLMPTSHYRAAHCADWPAVPDTLAGKSAVLSSLLNTTVSDPHTPSLRATPLDRGDSSQRKSPLERGAQRAGCVGQTSLSPHLLAAPKPSDGGSALNFSPEALLPAWFRSHCPAAFESPHLDALNSRAGVWVRIQCNDRALVLDEFRARQWTFDQPADFPDALCLPPNAEVAGSDAYRRGFIEIQDLGSQLVLACAPITPGGRWLDACAGAGGKTLHLARMLGDSGHVDATDIRPDILDELDARAKRARLTNVRITNIPDSSYDGVLVDAPCSGSGTWRRQPHLKWYVTADSIASFTRTQLEILDANAPRVKPGGLLIYATCSLSHHENHDVVATFLTAHPQFKPEPSADTHGGTFDGLGTLLLPGTRNTDGFYVALLRRT